MRKRLANGMCCVGFAGIGGGAWVGFGLAAGLAVSGVLLVLFGLVFVDVDKTGGHVDGEPAA